MRLPKPWALILFTFAVTPSSIQTCKSAQATTGFACVNSGFIYPSAFSANPCVVCGQEECCQVCADGSEPAADHLTCKHCDAGAAGTQGRCLPCGEGRSPSENRTQCTEDRIENIGNQIALWIGIAASLLAICAPTGGAGGGGPGLSEPLWLKVVNFIEKRRQQTLIPDWFIGMFLSNFYFVCMYKHPIDHKLSGLILNSRLHGMDTGKLICVSCARSINEQDVPLITRLADWKSDFPRQINFMCVGNAGVGKSTLLNGLLGFPYFQSGFKAGSGLTFEFDQIESGGHKYFDTPGLADPEKRQQAGQAIEEALQQDGCYIILFVLCLQGGRVASSDTQMIRCILNACKVIGSNYGIIINKVAPGEKAQYNEGKGQATQDILFQIFGNVKAIAQTGYIFVNLRSDELEGQANQAPELPQGLLDFIKRVPKVEIGKQDVDCIDTKTFDADTQKLDKAMTDLQADIDRMNGALREAKRCQHCCQVQENLQQHLLRCDERDWECPLGCGVITKFKESVSHRTTCPHRMVPCPDCTNDVRHKDLATHQRDYCSLRRSTRCECGEDIAHNKMEEHKVLCKARARNALRDAVSNDKGYQAAIDHARKAGLDDADLDLHLALERFKVRQASAKLLAAAKSGNVAEIISSMKIGADMTFLPEKDEDPEGRSPIHWAAERGHAHAIQTLLGLRAQVGVKCKNNHSALTPIDLAAENEHIEAVKLLADQGATVDEKRHIYLHRAIEKNNVDLIWALIKAGAPVDAKKVSDLDDPVLVKRFIDNCGASLRRQGLSGKVEYRIYHCKDEIEAWNKSDAGMGTEDFYLDRLAAAERILSLVKDAGL